MRASMKRIHKGKKDENVYTMSIERSTAVRKYAIGEER
jgi:hypothetical protein